MSDIISARCFGCGHTIKVPAGLGGKKARCPQCTNTITIPNPNDTQTEDIIQDADLPEVAVDGEKFVAEEGDAPHPDAVPEVQPDESPSEQRRRLAPGTGVRRSGGSGQTSTTNPRVQRSGTQQRYSPQGGGPAKPAPAASNQGMMIGIGLGVVALIIIAVVVAGKGDKGKTGGGEVKKSARKEERETPKAVTPQYSPEDQALVSKTLEYAAAVNRGDTAVVFRFYTYEPEDERKTRIKATELVDQKVLYDNPQITSVSAANGTSTFTYGGGKTKSLQWKQVDSVWMIAEKPSP